MTQAPNTKKRSEEIQTLARSLVKQERHDSLTVEARKPLRVVWQKQLIEATGCAPFTARSHIAKALRRERYENHKEN